MFSRLYSRRKEIVVLYIISDHGCVDPFTSRSVPTARQPRLSGGDPHAAQISHNRFDVDDKLVPEVEVRRTSPSSNQLLLEVLGRTVSTSERHAHDM